MKFKFQCPSIIFRTKYLFHLYKNERNRATLIHLCITHDYFLTTRAELKRCGRLSSPQILKYFLFGPLPKKFAKPCCRIRASCSWDSFYCFLVGLARTLACD